MKLELAEIIRDSIQRKDSFVASLADMPEIDKAMACCYAAQIDGIIGSTITQLIKSGMPAGRAISIMTSACAIVTNGWAMMPTEYREAFVRILRDELR